MSLYMMIVYITRKLIQMNNLLRQGMKDKLMNCKREKVRNNVVEMYDMRECMEYKHIERNSTQRI